jgi:hypothetical protein
VFVRKLLQASVVVSSTQPFIFGEYTYAFVMHVVFDNFIVDMVMYDMQV